MSPAPTTESAQLPRVPDLLDPAVLADLRARGILRGGPKKPKTYHPPRRHRTPEERAKLKQAAAEYLERTRYSRKWGLGAVIAHRWGISIRDLHEGVNDLRRAMQP